MEMKWTVSWCEHAATPSTMAAGWGLHAGDDVMVDSDKDRLADSDTDDEDDEQTERDQHTLDLVGVVSLHSRGVNRGQGRQQTRWLALPKL